MQDLDNQDIQDQPNEGSNYAPAPNNDREKLEETFKNRLKVERQKAEAESKKAESLAKELKELKSKFDRGTATSAQSSEYVSTENKIEESKQQGIPHEALPGIIEEHMQIQKLQASVADASEKDPELKALLADPTSLQKVSAEELMLLKHLDNAPAVFKHLLKDPRDLQTLKATERAWGNGDGGVSFFQFINNLSRQLDSTAKYPHPPSYSPSVSLDDVGTSDSFETGNYINEKYK